MIYNNKCLFQMIIIKTFGFIGEKSEKIYTKVQLSLLMILTKNGSLKIYFLLHFSIYQYENNSKSSKGDFAVKYRTNI